MNRLCPPTITPSGLSPEPTEMLADAPDLLTVT
jgi:hypothetical protein